MHPRGRLIGLIQLDVANNTVMLSFEIISTYYPISNNELMDNEQTLILVIIIPPVFSKWGGGGGGYTGLHLSVFPFPFVNFLVKDFSTIMQARIVIFGMQVGDDLLYRGIENQPSLTYTSLYLSNFLSFYT